jgi:hypothetical protein
MRKTTVITLLFLLLAQGQFAFAQIASKKALSKALLQAERVIEDSELQPVAAQSCGPRSSLKSLNGDTRTFLRFRNKSSKDVTFYWINYEGQRDQKRTLKPGEEQNLWTFLTHPFVFVDAKGACTAVYLPQKEFGLVVISEAPK